MATHLVVETNPDGHRLNYVRLLTEGADVVWLTSAVALASAEAHQYLDPAVRADAIVARVRRSLLREASGVAAGRNIRHIVVPDGDTHLRDALVAVPVLLRRHQHLTVLVMRSGRTGTSRKAAVAIVVKRALVRILSAGHTVRVLQLTDCYGVGRAVPQLAGAELVRDPIAEVVPGENPMAVQMLCNRPWVGICGVVDQRKNPAMAARAVLQHPTVGLVLAGVQTTGTIAALAAEPAAAKLRSLGRLVELPGLLTDSTLRAVVRDLTAVLVLHDNDSPSGVMGIASNIGTPVVVPSGGWLARIVEVTGCGVAATLETSAVAAAIETIVDNYGTYSTLATRALDGVAQTAFAEQLLKS